MDCEAAIRKQLGWLKSYCKRIRPIGPGERAERSAERKRRGCEVAVKEGFELLGNGDCDGALDALIEGHASVDG